ncbi:MAG: peptide deformylase [Pseudonocardiales bacterium]|nr:peptide deformylase [Pseudonocardiales bacterium]
MAVRPIRILGDPVLRAPTEPVTEFGDELAGLVVDLFDTMAAAHGVGLAANQIGVPLRVFVYDCPDEVAGVRARGVMVNPVMETSPVPETMPDPEADWEGCLSLPGEQFPTGRADWARVVGVDEHGQPVEVEAHGFLARCMQHEMDHLDGVLYVDRLVGRNAREARRALRRNGWGGPGLSWQPGDAADPEHLRRLDR